MAENKIDIQARVRVFYDYDLKSYIFLSMWNSNHSIRRTVTVDQVEIIKDMIMGTHIKVSPIGE
jgi:hypothetical protein